MTPKDLLGELIGDEHRNDLSILETKVVYLQWFYHEYTNGGWDQYLINSSRETAPAVYEYMKELGFRRIVEAFELIRIEIPNGLSVEEFCLREWRANPINETIDNKISKLIDEEIHDVPKVALNIIGQNHDHFLDKFRRRRMA